MPAPLQRSVRNHRRLDMLRFPALPPELLTHVLSFLMPDSLCRVAATCHGLRESAISDDLWIPHALIHFGYPPRLPAMAFYLRRVEGTLLITDSVTPSLMPPLLLCLRDAVAALRLRGADGCVGRRGAPFPQREWDARWAEAETRVAERGSQVRWYEATFSLAKDRLAYHLMTHRLVLPRALARGHCRSVCLPTFIRQFPDAVGSAVTRGAFKLSQFQLDRCLAVAEAHGVPTALRRFEDAMRDIYRRHGVAEVLMSRRQAEPGPRGRR